MPMNNLFVAFLLIALVADTVQAQNSPCWICDGGGPSMMANPDFLMNDQGTPVPIEFARAILITEADCKQMRRYAEMPPYLVPDILCPGIQQSSLPTICGCQNPPAAQQNDNDVVTAAGSQQGAGQQGAGQQGAGQQGAGQFAADATVPVPGETPCYMCGDGGASTITKPNAEVMVPLELTGVIPTATTTCDEVRRAAEVLFQVPNGRCKWFRQRKHLQEACGCQNAQVQANEAPVYAAGGVPTSNTGVTPITYNSGQLQSNAGGSSRSSKGSRSKGMRRKTRGFLR